MSILIKGMKMPKNCMLCSFCVEEADPANGEMCLVTGKLMPPCNHERLDDCPLIEVPEWIPVTERLPESVCKSYLCLTDTGYHCEVRWTNNVYGLWKSDNIGRWGWSIADVPQYCKITHWMPLPEPPKDGET